MVLGLQSRSQEASVSPSAFWNTYSGEVSHPKKRSLTTFRLPSVRRSQVSVWGGSWERSMTNQPLTLPATSKALVWVEMPLDYSSLRCCLTEAVRKAPRWEPQSYEIIVSCCFKSWNSRWQSNNHNITHCPGGYFKQTILWISHFLFPLLKI